MNSRKKLRDGGPHQLNGPEKGCRSLVLGFMPQSGSVDATRLNGFLACDARCSLISPCLVCPGVSPVQHGSKKASTAVVFDINQWLSST